MMQGLISSGLESTCRALGFNVCGLWILESIGVSAPESCMLRLLGGSWDLVSKVISSL